MAEIAEDTIDGTKCFLCGVYFEKTHGYPVLCDDCYKNMTKEEIKEYGYQKHIYKEL